ncbi:penicillin-binding protein activator [Oceaniovalibus sp. ACAM 378]|uniref:penicillin-binding protein activator n=1 Tax=Oceaniovalibus sp. ACAM 378 TaxID=2599923 RepID=UPI0011D791D7|nr:penicillin-binding protein activator [Oceaniovalibus sp. ACAM 378]
MFAFLSARRKAPIPAPRDALTSMRNLRRSVLLAACGFALAACEPVALGKVGGGPSIDASAPVPVALLVPSSSADGGAIIARSLENAARLAIADLKGVKIDLRVYDTGGQPARAAEVASQAVADGAKIILGPVFQQSANAAGLAVAGQGINVLSFSNSTAIAGGNLYILGHTFENSAQRLVGYAKQQGKSRIYVIHGNNAAEIQGRDAITGAIQANGATLAGVGGFDLSQQGVNAAVPRLAAEAKAAGATAVFMTSGTAGALPLLVEGLPGAGLSPATTQFVGLQRLDVPANALSLPGLQGSWFALPDPNLNARFNSRYAATYGGQPHAIAGLAYDGIAAIGALVASGKSNALTGAALTQGSGFIGVNGVFRLRPDGTNQRGMAVAQIRNNQVVVIDPAPKSFGGAGF